MDRSESLIYSDIWNQLLLQVLIHQFLFVNKKMLKKKKIFVVQGNFKR